MQRAATFNARQLPRSRQAMLASAVVLAHGLGLWLALTGLHLPTLPMASQSLAVSWADAEAPQPRATPVPAPAAPPSVIRPVAKPARVAEVLPSVLTSTAPQAPVAESAAQPVPQPVAVPASRPEVPAAPVAANPVSTAAATTPAEPAEVQLKELSVRDQVRPQYPALSRKLGESGTAQLRLLVAANGKVAQVQLKRSSGFPRLDESAVVAARQWLFSPPTRFGVAQSVWVVVPVSFGLEG